MSLSCNAFGDNTFLDTARLAQCVRNTDNLAPFEEYDERDLVLILDSLIRLANGEGSGEFPDITSDVNACDVQEAAYNARCAIAEKALQSNNLTPAKVKALIFYMLNEALCP